MNEVNQAQLPLCPFSGAPAELWLPLGSTEWLLTCVEKDCICSLLGGCPNPDWMREAWSRRSGKQYECPTCAHTPESYTRLVNEPQNEAGETAVEPEDIIYALRARIAQYEAAAHTGQAAWAAGYAQALSDARQAVRLRADEWRKRENKAHQLNTGFLKTRIAEDFEVDRALSHLAVPAVAGESERCVNHCEHDPKWAGMSQDGLIARCLLAAFDIKRKGEAASRPTPSAVRRAAEIYTKIEPYIEWEKVAMATCADGKTTPQFITELIEAELTKES